MPATGITTFIGDTVFRGVQFQRLGCRGMGNASAGIKLGRRVDAAFKDWCTTGVQPKAEPHVARRMASIAAALTGRGISMTESNVFVKRNQLRTHIDGVGKHRLGDVVVVELKSTQASQANHAAAYDVACAALPSVVVAGVTLPNTERTRHMLQLSFCLLATGAKRGVVVVSTSDGAAIYPLNRRVSDKIFDIPVAPKLVRPKPTAATKPRKKGALLATWPGASVAAAGWTQMATCGRKAAVLRRRDVLVFAVAVKRDTRAVDAALRSAAVAAKLEPRPRIGMVCTPLRGKWQTRRVRL